MGGFARCFWKLSTSMNAVLLTVFTMSHIIGDRGGRGALIRL